MPTKLGNILRAAETRPRNKYGLVTAVCWPRLWFLLPQETKQEIAEARALLDTAARIFLWGLLFLVWVIWAWWAPLVTLLVTFWAYRWSLSTAEVYGDLLESAFDLYRFALYEAIHYSLPKNPQTEKEKGLQLTTYLFRGPNKKWNRSLVGIGLILIVAIILKRSPTIYRSILSRWLTAEKS